MPRMSLLRIALGAMLALMLALAALLALVVQPGITPQPSHSPTVDAERLHAHVKHLSVDLYPRSFDQRDQLERAMDYVAREFTASGARVELQAVTAEGETYRNVIARFGPTAAADVQLLVIGAHVDSHGDTATGAQFPKGHALSTHTPGADDNASGVAGLIELAHLLGKQPPLRPVELVAYTLEEPPHFRTEHMGSAWHARSLRAAGRDVRLMVSLEMIGYFRDAPRSQRFPVPGLDRLYPDRGNFIALVSRISASGDLGATRRAKALMAGATDLAVHSINAPPLLQGIDFSDHLSYWAQGYPALMVTDTAFFRNSNYHQAGDTHETLDYVRMAKVVQGVFVLAQRF
jgi:Zn-dependent M28 family amino/carboxypeptidase